MKIPAWLRKKPSGTRTVQLSCVDCAYYRLSNDFLTDMANELDAANAKLAAALVQKDDWQQQSKNWQEDVMRWRIHAQAAESKLAAALAAREKPSGTRTAQSSHDNCAYPKQNAKDWKNNASYWMDRAEAAESKLAARQASLAKYEVKRKAKREAAAS